MPSGAKKRKAKKKKQAGEAHAPNQNHGTKEDSGNEQELENEQEQEDPITPKTPVQTNEVEEKEKAEVEGGSSDADEVGSLDHGSRQNQDNRTQTSFQEVGSTDINLVIPENGDGGLENKVEVSSGGALEDKDGPIGNLGSLTSTDEGHPKAAPSSSSSPSSFHHDGDETQHDEKESRTDVGVIELGLHNGDESEVSSSKVIVSEENEPNQTVGPKTNVNETLPSPKDDEDNTRVGMEVPSEELESSDDDESKLDVVSTMATLDANESIQSVGSVDSPRSVYSQQYLDQVSNERAELASQDQDRGSEGYSEIPFKEIGSKADFLNAESADKPVYKDGMEFLQESSKGLRNEENMQVSTEVVSDNYAEIMEELTHVITDLEKTQVESSVSLAAAIEESLAIPKVDENDAKESVMPLSKSESVNTRHISLVSTSGEAGEKAVSTSEEASERMVPSGEATGEAGEKVISTGETVGAAIGKANQDVVSAGGAGKDDMGSIKAQGTSADTNEISDKDKTIALHPRNGTNENNINLPQRESRTSWLSCCGIVDLFTSTRS